MVSFWLMAVPSPNSGVNRDPNDLADLPGLQGGLSAALEANGVAEVIVKDLLKECERLVKNVLEEGNDRGLDTIFDGLIRWAAVLKPDGPTARAVTSLAENLGVTRRRNQSISGVTLSPSRVPEETSEDEFAHVGAPTLPPDAVFKFFSEQEAGIGSSGAVSEGEPSTDRSAQDEDPEERKTVPVSATWNEKTGQMGGPVPIENVVEVETVLPSADAKQLAEREKHRDELLRDFLDPEEPKTKPVPGFKEEARRLTDKSIRAEAQRAQEILTNGSAVKRDTLNDGSLAELAIQMAEADLAQADESVDGMGKK